MADLIRLTSGIKTLSGAGPFLQAITEVVDVSMVDQVDLRFYLHSLTGGGTVTFELLTAMEAKGDADWESMGSVALPGAGSAPTFKSTTFPQPVLATTTEVPVPLLNYIRWRVSFRRERRLCTSRFGSSLVLGVWSVWSSAFVSCSDSASQFPQGSMKS